MRGVRARRLATVVVAALLGLPMASCASGPVTSPSSTTAASAFAPTSDSTSGALPAVREVTEAGASVITAVPNPDWAVAAAGSVWVAGVGPGLQRYDEATGATTGEVAIYSVCSAMDQGFGSVWAMSCDYSSPKLVRIDAATGTSVAEIPMPARLPPESSIGVGEGAVWLLTSGNERQLLAVDPATNNVARTFPAPQGARAVRAGFGSVWVSVTTPGQVLRIDPTSGATVAKVDVGRDASFLAVGPDSVWVISASDATVSRVDPATNSVRSTITVSSGGVSGGDIAASVDAIWVRVTDDAVAVRIDPQANEVVERLGPSAGSGGVAIAETSVWITAHDRRSIWRLPR